MSRTSPIFSPSWVTISVPVIVRLFLRRSATSRSSPSLPSASSPPTTTTSPTLATEVQRNALPRPIVPPTNSATILSDPSSKTISRTFPCFSPLVWRTTSFEKLVHPLHSEHLLLSPIAYTINDSSPDKNLRSFLSSVFETNPSRQVDEKRHPARSVGASSSP